ncbi:MAG TPA: glycoside hydrolase family 88 protein [Polyangiaceae bacterium]|nr:glycoside hydrolase family 88 protein [Polyangiaceae bacterium]
MSSRDNTRPRTTQRRIPGWLMRSLFGLSLLPVAAGCSSDKIAEPQHHMDGNGGGSAPIPSVAGGGSGVIPSQGGGGGTVVSAAGGSAGSVASASGGSSPATGGSGGQAPASGGSANGSCAFQCVDQCMEAGGTKKDGTCSGTQICCDGATTSPAANPFADLVPSAKDVGLLLANRFSKQSLSFKSVKDLPGDGYKVACEWYGSLRVAKYTNTQTLVDTLVTKFDPLKGDFVSAMTGGEKHVDRFIFGIVPLEIYIQTSKAEYLPLGAKVASAQDKSQVRNAIDDMFMMPILQVEAYRAVKAAPPPDGGEAMAAAYLNFMAPIMVDYLKVQKADGLFNHNDAQAQVEWGRGNGWFAAGMAEMLKDLPKSSPQYATIEDGYKRMMAGLLKVQHKDGLWYQVLNLPNDSKNWLETSGSAMFTYAMISGVRRGVLDAATYVPAVKNAWAALQKKISAQGDVSGICPGTYFHASAAEYEALSPITGDGHGQAPVLWAAMEILR